MKLRPRDDVYATAVGTFHSLTIAVTINGAPITVISQTPIAIVGLTPPGQPGLATVLVTSPSGCAATASYTYQ